MKVLLTGANGYIGTRLLPALLEQGHEVVCLVRDKKRFLKNNPHGDKVTVVTGDLLKEISIQALPPDIDAAYYLSHSITGDKEFSQLEALSAHHFVQALNYTQCKQLVFLNSIRYDDRSRQRITTRRLIEGILHEANAALTILRSAMIIGKGNPQFDILCELTEKHPIMAMPVGIKNQCQPIAISDVLAYLTQVLMNEQTFSQAFEIGGPDILSYKDMMLGYAKAHKLRRNVIVMPFPSIKTASYWLCFSSSATYLQAQSLVKLMKHDAIVKDKRINKLLPRKCLGYAAALAADAGEYKEPQHTAPERDAQTAFAGAAEGQ